MQKANPIDTHVGKRLKMLRLLRGMTQSDIGRAVQLSFQQVQKYELGRNRISASKLYELATLLDVEVTYFFEGLDETGGGGPVLDEREARIACQLARVPNGPMKDSIHGMIAAAAEQVAA